MQAIQQGRSAQWSSGGWIYCVVPVRPEAGMRPWSVKVGYPESVAMRPVRELVVFKVPVAVTCPVLTALLLTQVVGRLMRPLGEFSESVEALAGGNSTLDAQLAV